MYIFVLLYLTQATMMLDSSVDLTLTEPQLLGSDFESSMEVNGITYTTICDCVSPELTEQQTVKCAPSTIVLTEEISGEGASLEEVQEKLQSADYTFVNVPASSFRCIDGRITSESLGAFGGDLGEFGIALLVYEDLSGKRLDEESVNLYLTEYIECMEQEYFYWCSDDEATSHVEQKLGIEGVDFLNPRDDLEDAMLDLLIQPDGIGDLHLKNLIKYPEKYSIRPEALQLLITVFYKMLWNEDDIMQKYLYLEIFPGDHNETAFLEIRTIEDCYVQQIAPLIIPRVGNKDNLSLFVNHLDAVNIKRAQLSLFFAETVARNQDGITPDKFLSRMKHYGLMFLDVTGSLIAGTLPFYSAAFEN